MDLAGEIDFGNVGQLRSTLLEISQTRQGDVVLDMSRVSFIDSTTIGVIIQAKKRLAGTGRELIIAEPSERVRRTFEVAGLVEYLGV